MLMWLSERLVSLDPGFAVFQYLTLRGILAACTALVISMVVGPVVIDSCLLYTSDAADE